MKKRTDDVAQAPVLFDGIDAPVAERAVGDENPIAVVVEPAAQQVASESGSEGELGNDSPNLLEGDVKSAPAPAAPVFGFRRKSAMGF